MYIRKNIIAITRKCLLAIYAKVSSGEDLIAIIDCHGVTDDVAGSVVISVKQVKKAVTLQL